MRLVRLSVPSYKFVGESAVLRCLYDLEREQLYSVKWYKDGDEFFRYIPGDRDQTVTVFRLPGVNVDVSIHEILFVLKVGKIKIFFLNYF